MSFSRRASAALVILCAAPLAWHAAAQNQPGANSPQAAARALVESRAQSSAPGEPTREFLSILDFGPLASDADGTREALGLGAARIDLAGSLWRRAASPNLPPIECVRRGSGWRVDALATARRWLPASDAALRRAQVLAARQPAAAKTPQVLVASAKGEDARSRECLGRLREMARAMALYTADAGERFPPADRWQSALTPYAARSGAVEVSTSTFTPAPSDAVLQRLFHCPTLGDGGQGYAMNWKLSRRAVSEVDDPSRTAAFYETNIPRPEAAFDGRDVIARHTRTINGRAEAGGNYAFADGRAEWRAAGRVPNFQIFLRPRK